MMNLMRGSLGKFSICVGYRKVMDALVRLVRRGDDFSLSGRRRLCNAFRDELGKHPRRQLWPNAEMGDVQEAIQTVETVSSRRRGRRAMELESDPRHVEILVSQMGLSNESKALNTPGVRTTDEEDGKELGAEDRACH